MPKCICNTTKSQLRSKLSKIFHLLASYVLLLFVILYMTDIVCQHGGKWLVSAAVDGSYGFDSIGMLNVDTASRSHPMSIFLVCATPP